MTSDMEARRSVAMTGAPWRTSTPSTTSGIAIELYMGTEPDQFLHMHEPVFKNCFGDPRGAFGLGHQGHELGLQIRRKAGERRGGDIDR